MSREARIAYGSIGNWHFMIFLLIFIFLIFPDRRRYKRELASSISHLFSHFGKPRSMQIVTSLLRQPKDRQQSRKWRMIQLVQIGIVLSGGVILLTLFFQLRPLTAVVAGEKQAIISRVSLTPMRGDELIDVVYVYANKTHPRIIQEYQNLVEETTTDNRGILRSPPTAKNVSVDMDLMCYSVRMLKKMGKNLGSIFIVVKYEVELSLEIKQIPGVKVILESQLYEGNYFSSAVKECSQHRIPNLGTFYIAMNDDMVLTKPVDLRTFFFSSNGSPRTMNGDTTIESITHKVNRKIIPKKGGQHPQIKYSLEQLSGFVDVRPVKRLYPAHFPRPFHREFIDYVQSRNSVLFQSPFSKRFRCQECLSVFILSLLHSYETGGLRQANAFGSTLAYIDSPSIWNKVLQQWDGLVSITLQEVAPTMQAVVREFLEAKISEP
jgi:hypothetical protein